MSKYYVCCAPSLKLPVQTLIKSPQQDRHVSTSAMDSRNDIHILPEKWGVVPQPNWAPIQFWGKGWFP